MNARFFIDRLEGAIARSDASAQVMFSQDDGKVHLWGDGWEVRFTPGTPPVDIERFGTPPATGTFQDDVNALLDAWSSDPGVFSPADRARLRRYKASRNDG